MMRVTYIMRIMVTYAEIMMMVTYAEIMMMMTFAEMMMMILRMMMIVKMMMIFKIMMIVKMICAGRSPSPANSSTSGYSSPSVGLQVITLELFVSDLNFNQVD